MTQGSVVSICISEEAGSRPKRMREVRAVKNRGLEGDRYFTRKGTFSNSEPKGPGREITLIENETLMDLPKSFGVELSHEESRRNLLTENIRLNDLVGKKFKVGEVELEGIRLCHPCDHLESLTGKKFMVPLKNRGGLRANILTSGTIRVGDSITVERLP